MDDAAKFAGMPPAPKILYTRREAAYMLSLSEDTVAEIIRQGMMAIVRKGRRILVHRDELERFARVDTPFLWGPKVHGKTVRRLGVVA